MGQAECAVACFKEGFSCSQAVLATFAPQLGLERETALKIAGAFGGGMGRLGEVCGALTGALMALGLRYGCVNARNTDGKEEVYRLARELANEFRARHGAILCRELLGCDISTPEGRNLAREKGLFANLCPQLVRDAAEIVQQMLE
jgi:C_GCAxxG_C_C family probable redox protein